MADDLVVADPIIVPRRAFADPAAFDAFARRVEALRNAALHRT